MILLLGGTSDTAPLAARFAKAGMQALVSTATEVPLDIGSVKRRTGLLDEETLIDLIQRENIKAIVDATHPYAVQIKALAQNVAKKLNLPYFNYIRPSVIKENDSVIWAENHAQAAQIACSFGLPILLTTGSRNLEPYVRQANTVGVALIVRVLAVEEALQAGIAKGNIITGRGPFSVADNLSLIREFHIGVIVTKDGGTASGVTDKLEASKQEKCRLVVVRRPVQAGDNCFYDYDALVAAVL